MRVLLFCQTGDGRPRCMAGVPHDARSAEGGLHPAMLTTVQLRAVQAADRWWLVECENAEDGRKRIADWKRFMADPTLMNARGVGRILASGGKGA